uniref:(northern house mosquito) hypothetical protein n=1 Tax=Culex pipiens TaxID=7175 RepID=A0A8D8AFG0_CULPI
MPVIVAVATASRPRCTPPPGRRRRICATGGPPRTRPPTRPACGARKTTNTTHNTGHTCIRPSRYSRWSLPEDARRAPPVRPAYGRPTPTRNRRATRPPRRPPGRSTTWTSRPTRPAQHTPSRISRLQDRVVVVDDVVCSVIALSRSEPTVAPS